MAKLNLKNSTIPTPKDLAHEYASKGWPVFPCRPRYETVINSQGKPEPKKPKSPLTRFGFREATKTTKQIDYWWSQNPDALVGVPTGAPSGIWVLDIDVPSEEHTEDGRGWLAEMEELHGQLPATRMVTTASGGTHYYWRHVDGVRNKAALAPGVDTRGDGGFVCVPGSVLEDGTFYEWANDEPIADAPEWLLDMVIAPPSPAVSTQPMTYKSGTNDRYVDAAVDSELSDLAGTTQGSRGFRLNRSAFSLGQIVASGALSRSDAEAGLYNAALANGLVAVDGEREVLAKIRRGLDAGMKQPREIPEPDIQQDNTRLMDITRMIRNGLAKAKRNKETTIELPGVDPEREELIADYIVNHPEEYPLEEDTPLEEAADELPTEQEPANDNSPNGPITATAFKWIDPKTLPRREFAFGTHYIRKYVSVTVSPGGLGKTSNSIVEALAMASGKDLTGTKPPQRMKVWLFNAEDPRDELERRIMAACIHFKLKPEDIEGYLFLDTGREQELVVALEDKKAGVRIQQPVVEAVVEQMKTNGIDVMVVDPFVSTHGVNENDNGAIDKVAKLWSQIADLTNSSIDIVHHLRKVADREATVEDARGAVSLIGAARSVRVLNRMSEEQATTAGIEPAARFGYFSITYGKSNLTAMSHKLDWRRLESVPLGNGRGLTKPQDHAPVVTEWRWPSAEEAVGDVSAEQLAQIITRVRNTDCKLHHQAENWIGREVAYVLGLDIAIKADSARIKRLVKAWIDDGTFVVVNRRCPIKRENKDFVEVANSD